MDTRETNDQLYQGLQHVNSQQVLTLDSTQGAKQEEKMKYWSEEQRKERRNTTTRRIIFTVATAVRVQATRI